MSERTCLACDAPIDPSRRSDAKACPTPSCRMWVQRHPGVKKPPPGPISYVCQHDKCGKTFTREKLHAGKRPKFCSDYCWEQYRYYNIRPYWYQPVENPFEPREYTCVDCRESGKDNGAGPIPVRCASCALNRSREASNQWQLDNRERSREIKRTWREANPEYSADWYQRNKPAVMEAQRRYQELNRDRVRQWKRDRENRRRARKLSRFVEDFTSLEVFERDEWVCGICIQAVDPELSWPHPFSASLDHIMPISKGGAHVLCNVQLAHLGCNIRKGDSLGT